MLRKYSNGWGHLIMSIVFLAAGIYLIASSLSAQPTNQATLTLGISLVSIVASAWFVPNAAKQVAQEVRQEVMPAAIAQTVANAAAPAVAQTVAAVMANSGPVLAVTPEDAKGS